MLGDLSRSRERVKMSQQTGAVRKSGAPTDLLCNLRHSQGSHNGCSYSRAFKKEIKPHGKRKKHAAQQLHTIHVG